ncbi:hypothetical protein ACJJTC_006050 [Scirpophaga incertulas]
MNTDFAVQFSWQRSAGAAAGGRLYVRATVVFSDKEQAQKRVERCLQHLHETTSCESRIAQLARWQRSAGAAAGGRLYVRATVVFSDKEQAQKRVERCLQHLHETTSCESRIAQLARWQRSAGAAAGGRLYVRATVVFSDKEQAQKRVERCLQHLHETTSCESRIAHLARWQRSAGAAAGGRLYVRATVVFSDKEQAQKRVERCLQHLHETTSCESRIAHLARWQRSAGAAAGGRLYVRATVVFSDKEQAQKRVERCLQHLHETTSCESRIAHLARWQRSAGAAAGGRLYVRATVVFSDKEQAQKRVERCLQHLHETTSCESRIAHLARWQRSAGAAAGGRLYVRATVVFSDKEQAQKRVERCLQHLHETTSCESRIAHLARWQRSAGAAAGGRLYVRATVVFSDKEQAQKRVERCLQHLHETTSCESRIAQLARWQRSAGAAAGGRLYVRATVVFSDKEQAQKRVERCLQHLHETTSCESRIAHLARWQRSAGAAAGGRLYVRATVVFSDKEQAQKRVERCLQHLHETTSCESRIAQLARWQRSAGAAAGGRLYVRATVVFSDKEQAQKRVERCLQHLHETTSCESRIAHLARWQRSAGAAAGGRLYVRATVVFSDKEQAQKRVERCLQHLHETTSCESRIAHLARWQRSAGAAAGGRLYVRATVVFSDKEQAQKRVERCLQHLHETTSSSLPKEVRMNVLRSSRELGTGGVAYHGAPDAADSWLSVLVECPGSGPPLQHAYKFVCKNSCATGINRRNIAIVFTLENDR